MDNNLEFYEIHGEHFPWQIIVVLYIMFISISIIFGISGIIFAIVFLSICSIYIFTRKRPVFRISEKKIEAFTHLFDFEINWEEIEKIIIQKVKRTNEPPSITSEESFLLIFIRADKQKKIELFEFSKEKQKEILDTLETFAVMLNKQIIKEFKVKVIDNNDEMLSDIKAIQNIDFFVDDPDEKIEKIESYYQEKYDWKEIETPNLENTKNNKIFKNFEFKSEKLNEKNLKLNLKKNNLDTVIIEETFKIKHARQILEGIFLPLIFFLLGLLFMNILSLIFTSLLGLIFWGLYIFVIIGSVKKYKLIISNEEIIYEELKDGSFFKIKWSEFDKIQVRTDFYIFNLRSFEQKIRKKTLFFIKGNKVERRTVHFTNKKMQKIIEYLKLYANKINKEVVVENEEKEISMKKFFLDINEDGLITKKDKETNQKLKK